MVRFVDVLGDSDELAVGGARSEPLRSLIRLKRDLGILVEAEARHSIRVRQT